MKVSIDDDFNLQKIIDSGQCFRPCLTKYGYRFISRNESKGCTQILYISEQPYAGTGVVGSSNEKIYSEKPIVFNASCTEDEWDGFWRDYFDLARCYAAIRNEALKNADSFLSSAAEVGAGIRLLRQNPFETLISFIISQRKSIPAIRTSIERLCDLFGEKINTDHEIVKGFPSPEALSNAPDDALASCGLGYRLPYIKAAAIAVSTGEIDFEKLCKLDDKKLFERLLSIHGVGPKIANCVMLFGFGRAGRAPVDTWIKKLIENKYAGKNPFPTYGDAAGIMQQYAFYYMQMTKDLF